MENKEQGTIQNQGSILVEKDGSLTAGAMTNAGNISVSGSMDGLTGKIENTGHINVETTGSLVAGEMTNAKGAEVEVHGVFRAADDHALKNDGTIVVNAGGGGRVEG